MSQTELPAAHGLAASAANPHTSPAVLREIAYHYPQLRLTVAQNPACYPALRRWIHEQEKAGNATTGELFPLTPVAQSPQKSHWPLLVTVIVAALVLAGGTWFLLREFGARNDGAGGGTEPTIIIEGKDPQPEEPAKTPAPSVEPTTEERFPAPEGSQTVGLVRSPSGNIECVGGQDSLTCTIVTHDWENTDQENCTSTQFTQVILGSEGARRTCGGALIPQSGGSVTVAYGSSAVTGSFACTSTEKGMSCWNRYTGKAIALARQGWTSSDEGPITEANFPW
ncbi:hypothetical protein [Schaalia suimastitidis]|uniref:variant leucine-rich repeat-containing protein n=1 Tax=Schaalia suimastitidis TaxID=121163 RepID=UPI0004232065|nr:hypothetical protein [Schaalia suimastitidis]